MIPLRKDQFLELWRDSWFFRTNIVAAVVGLVYWLLH